MLRYLLNIYKRLVSPFLGDCCRFHPSCSEYAVEAIENHGVIRGTLLAVKRVLRCNPLVKGWLDPVPPKK